MRLFVSIFMYAFEQMVAYLYFNNRNGKYKVQNIYGILAFILSFILQFSLNFLNHPEINIISFLICNLMLSILVYKSSIKRSVFDVVILEMLMIVTEYIVMYGSITLKIATLEEFQNNPNVFLLETLACKSMYFIFSYILSKAVLKNKNTNRDNYSIILMIIPIDAVLILFAFAYMTTHLDLDDTTIRLFIITSMLTLVAGVIAAYVHEKATSTLKENMEYQLIFQKNEINEEHYKELEKQNALANVLVHDIKRHLNIIQALSFQGDTNGIIDYIKSVQNSSEIKTIRQYSDNTFVNVIITRYAHLCMQNGIDLFTDIRSVDLSFLDQSDLTSLLDNILENAFEASKQSEERKISVRIEEANGNYIAIKVENFYDTTPLEKDGLLITNKPNKHLHGNGVKITRKIAEKYNGCIDYKFENNKFEIVVLLAK